ncbi:MAG: hypothetical protein ACI8W7_000745, partial [Gammaproteobacteria bacterium]
GAYLLLKWTNIERRSTAQINSAEICAHTPSRTNSHRA